MFERYEVRVTMDPAGKAKTWAERFDLVDPRVLRAVMETHRAYERLGIPHVLVGGLAVGVHARVRLTKHVDFLVGPEAFASIDPILSFKAGVPIAVEGVPIDSLRAPPGHEPVLDRALNEPIVFDGIPVIAPEYLVYMKLLAGRRQDIADVAALLAAESVDIDRARAILEGEMLATFEELVAESSG